MVSKMTIAKFAAMSCIASLGMCGRVTEDSFDNLRQSSKEQLVLFYHSSNQESKGLLDTLEQVAENVQSVLPEFLFRKCDGDASVINLGRTSSRHSFDALEPLNVSVSFFQCVSHSPVFDLTTRKTRQNSKKLGSQVIRCSCSLLSLMRFHFTQCGFSNTHLCLCLFLDLVTESKHRK